MKVAAAVTVSLLLAVAAAGTADAATPTKRDFIRKGDALCTSVLRELAPIRRRAEAAKLLPAEKQWAAAASIWGDQIAIQQRFNRRFRGLGVPAGDAAAARLVANLDRGVVLARRVRDAFARRDVSTLPGALRAYVDFALRTNRRVQAYGFRVCGRS